VPIQSIQNRTGHLGGLSTPAAGVLIVATGLRLGIRVPSKR
jgi:hypothetical protein